MITLLNTSRHYSITQGLTARSLIAIVLMSLFLGSTVTANQEINS